MKAPTLTIYVVVRNPNWKHGDSSDYYTHAEVEAEILSIHFNTKKIRLRYKDPLGATQVTTMHLDYFSKRYKIELDS